MVDFDSLYVTREGPAAGATGGGGAGLACGLPRRASCVIR